MTVASPLTIVAFALPLGLTHGHPDHAHWAKAMDADPEAATWPCLRQASVVKRHQLPDDSFNACHEITWAQGLGWQVSDGSVPLAAWQAQRWGWQYPPSHGWAFIDAVNWHINQAQVHLHVPTPITPEESDALLQAMQPFMTQDDIHLHPLHAGRWLAHGPVFKELPSVSLDQVNSQRIDAFLQPDSVAAQNPAQRQLRRLQNEMQMLLYTHAVNDHRAIALNSIWFSGTGDLPPSTEAAPRTVVLHEGLREAWLSHTPTVFLPAFKAVVNDLIAPALMRHEQVLLCNPQRSVLLEAQTPNLLRRLHQRWRPVLLSEVLQ